MVRMQAPDGATGVVFQGVAYPVEHGFVEVPDQAERELRGHGYRRAAPDAAAVKELVARMDRSALLAYLRERGVTVVNPVGNEKLRETVRAMLAKHHAE